MEGGMVELNNGVKGRTLVLGVPTVGEQAGKSPREARILGVGS